MSVMLVCLSALLPQFQGGKIGVGWCDGGGGRVVSGGTFVNSPGGE